MSINRLSDWRRPGCSAACFKANVVAVGQRQAQTIEVHDPAVHEQYGSGQPLTGAGTIVRTGPLEIDFDRMDVRVNEQSVGLTKVQYRIMMALASQVGSVVSHRDLLTQAWGPAYADDDHSVARSAINRLRDRLGEAGSRVVTVLHVGYRLADEPICRVSSPPTVRWKHERAFGPMAGQILRFLNERIGCQINVRDVSRAIYGGDTIAGRSGVYRAARLFQTHGARVGLLVGIHRGNTHREGWVVLHEPFQGTSR